MEDNYSIINFDSLKIYILMDGETSFVNNVV